MRSLVILLLLLCRVAGAETRLLQLLAQQRQSYAAACITSGFYDPRGISRYRTQPGLHLGYDIAMPYGSKVRAAWSGTVVAIVPWAAGEWGVTVQHGDGTRATYGHVTPLLAVGTRVEPGTLLATIASDHLDVKMRDAAGLALDYGQGQGPNLAMAAPLSNQQAELERTHTELAQAFRQDSKRRDYSQPEWEQLLSLGLVVGPRPTPVAPPPFRKYLALRQQGTPPAWSQSDRDRLQERQQNLQELELRYKLGLVSRKQIESTRAELSQWKRVLEDEN